MTRSGYLNREQLAARGIKLKPSRFIVEPKTASELGIPEYGAMQKGHTFGPDTAHQFNPGVTDEESNPTK